MSEKNIGSISAIRIFTHELAGAKQFYGDRLGFSINLETPDCLIFKTGSAQLIIESIATNDEPHKEYVGRFTGISFDVDDIQAIYKKLAGNDVIFEGKPETQDWGGILAHFKDPDGNILTLVQHP